MILADLCDVGTSSAATVTSVLERRRDRGPDAAAPPRRPPLKLLDRPLQPEASLQEPMLAPEASGFSQQAQRFFAATDREHRVQRERLRGLLSDCSAAQAATLLRQFLRVFAQTPTATAVDDAADLLAQIPHLPWFLQQPYPEIDAEGWYVLALALARAPLAPAERVARLYAMGMRKDAPPLLLEGVARGLGFVGFYHEDARPLARQLLGKLKGHEAAQVRAEATAQLEELSG